MRLLLVVLRFQYLRTVDFQDLNLLSYVLDVFFNDFECIIELRASLVVVWHVIDVDLNKQCPLFLLSRQLDRLLSCGLMFPANVNRSSHVEDAFIFC